MQSNRSFFLPPCEYHKLNTLPLHYNGWQQIPLSKPIPIGKYNINDLQFLLLQKVKKKRICDSKLGGVVWCYCSENVYRVWNIISVFTIKDCSRTVN